MLALYRFTDEVEISLLLSIDVRSHGSKCQESRMNR